MENSYINPAANGQQPAFPQEICKDGGNPPFKGLTKLEYFAVRAPKVIPKWFKPVMEERPVKPAYVMGLFINENKKYIESFDEENDTFDPSADVPKEFQKKVFAQIKLLDEWLEKDNEWERTHNIERVIQWPLFYANKLLRKISLSK